MALNRDFRVKDSLNVGISGLFRAGQASSYNGSAVAIDTYGKILSGGRDLAAIFSNIDLADLTNGVGINTFSYDGNTAATVSVAGANVLSAGRIVSWDGSKFVNSTLSDTNIVSLNTTVNSKSANWDSVYTTTNTTSGRWESVYTLTNSKSATWDSVYSTTNTNSASWVSTRTTVNSNSANWDLAYGWYTGAKPLSGKWESVYTTVNTNSAGWESVESTVLNTSASWVSTRGTVNTLSGKWESVYTTTNSKSANWDNVYSSYNSASGNYAVKNADNNFSAEQTINSNLYVQCNITAGTNQNNNGLQSTILGGDNNLINGAPLPINSSIVGGEYNIVADNSCDAVIVGGNSNYIDTSRGAVILGGDNNNVTGSSWAGVLGGQNNTISGLSGTFIIGSNITAVKQGAVHMNEAIVLGPLSAQGIVYALGGNSTQWNSNYSTVNSCSATWGSGGNAYSILTSNSGEWDSVYSTTNTNSASWVSTRTTVNSNSANWDLAYGWYSTAKPLSSKWESVYTTVNTSSAGWESTESTVLNTSGKWESNYTTTNTNSARWGSVYTSYNGASANLVNSINSSASQGTILYNTLTTSNNAINLSNLGAGGSPTFSNLSLTNNLNVSGNTTIGTAASDTLTVNAKASFPQATSSANSIVIGGDVELYRSAANTLTLPDNVIVTGNHTVYGNLSVTGDFTYLDTTVTSTSALSVVNLGTGPAIYIEQGGVQPVAVFKDRDGGNVVITDTGSLGIGTTVVAGSATYPEKLTVVGNISATGTVKLGGLAAATSNSVVVETNGVLGDRNINPGVWDTTAKFISGSGTENYIPIFNNATGVTDSGIVSGSRTGTVSVYSFNQPVYVSGNGSGNPVFYSYTTPGLNRESIYAASGGGATTFSLSTIPATNVISVRFYCTAWAGAGHRSAFEVLAVSDGTTVYGTVYGLVEAGANALISTVDASINGGIILLNFTTSQTSSYVIAKVMDVVTFS